MTSGRLRLAFAVVLVAAIGCTGDWVDLASDPRLDGSIPPPIDAGRADTGIGKLPDARPNLDAMPMPAVDAADPFTPVARCGDLPCACDDGIDNDADGLRDGLDPECTGALDEDEATFATGKPSKMKACRDCFWDEDPGTGNDACRYASECLRGTDPNGNGNCKRCDVEESCVSSCAARAPSGCDCFGCCEISRPDGTKVTVELSDRCSMATLDDTAACPRCMQSSQCRNSCERCELCPGRTADELPADCRGGSSSNRCDVGQAVCAATADCSIDQYCQLGCCFTLLL